MAQPRKITITIEGFLIGYEIDDDISTLEVIGAADWLRHRMLDVIARNDQEAKRKLKESGGKEDGSQS